MIIKHLPIKILVLLCLSLPAFSYAVMHDEEEPHFNLAVFGHETPEESIILERFALDDNVHFTNDLGEADTILIHDINLSSERLDQIKNKVVNQGSGLLLFLGPNISSESLSYILGSPVEVEAVNRKKLKSFNPNRLGGLSIAYTGPGNHPLSKIAWKSSVQIYEHSNIDFTNESFKWLVSTTQDDIAKDSEASVPIIVEAQLGKGTVYIFTPWIKKGNDEERGKNLLSVLIEVADDHNYSLYNWSYFNWLLHFMMQDAVQNGMPDFEDWKYSPVPKKYHIVILTIIVLSIFAIVLSLFFLVRRYSSRNPDLINHILHEPKTIKHHAKPAKGPIARFWQWREKIISELSSRNNNWEKIGFYRPLNAYMLVVIGMFVGFAPLIMVMHFQLTNFMPFPQAEGIQHWVALAFGLAFTVFDLGISIAMIKYFAEYRVDDPGRAMKFIQFYVWFQLISGIIQLGLLSILVAIFVPSTDYAFLSWVLIIRTLLQFPGFVIIFTHIFKALQRYDIMLILIAIRAPLAGLAALVVTLLARWWGLHNPQYGEVFGSTIGGGLSAFVAQWIILAISIFFYHRVGYSIKVVFLAHFDWRTIKQSLTYGLRVLPGQMAPFISLCAEPIILSYYLDNYLEIISMLIAVLWINGVIHAPGGFLNHNLLPSISEAYSHGYKNLSRMYIDQGIKWYLIFFLTVFPFFMIFGQDIFIGVVPEQWARAAELMVIGLLVGLTDVIARMPDETFKGTGYPQFYTYGNMFEHSLRLVLMIMLLPKFGAKGLLYAYIIAAILKGILVWFLLSKYIFKPKISWWQSIFAPLISAGILFVIGKTFAIVLGIDTPEESVPLVMLFFAVVPMGFFMNGFLGGFDEESLAEFKEALELNFITRRFIGYIFYWSVLLGLKLSPLKGKFTAANRASAAAEAEELMAKKVALE